MAEWHKDKAGSNICVHNPVRTAYKIILLLEKEKVPRICVDDVLKTVSNILDFQEITHTERDEENPDFPK